MYIPKFQTNKSFNKVQNLLAGGRSPGKIGTFIESVNDDINWTLPRRIQHFRQASFERINIGLSCAANIVRKWLGEDVVTSIRVGRKLGNGGGEQA
jgi:hypothetical protein